MCAKFDSETITLSQGERLTDKLTAALTEKGLAAKTEGGIFIIDDVIVQSIEGNEVKIEVEYEYGW